MLNRNAVTNAVLIAAALGGAVFAGRQSVRWRIAGDAHINLDSTGGVEVIRPGAKASLTFTGRWTPLPGDPKGIAWVDGDCRQADMVCAVSDTVVDDNQVKVTPRTFRIIAWTPDQVVATWGDGCGTETLVFDVKHRAATRQVYRDGSMGFCYGCTPPGHKSGPLRDAYGRVVGDFLAPPEIR